MSLPRYREYKECQADGLRHVPSHWSTPPLYLRYQSDLGKMLDAARISGAHLHRYLRNIDVQWGRINFDELPQMDVAPDEAARYTVRPGDLLVCEGGEVGRAAVVEAVEQPTAFQKALHRLRPMHAEEVPKYMFYVLRWAADAGTFSTGGQSTIAHLTGEQLRKYRFPCPPRAEQVAIAAFLDRETAKIDALIAEQEKLIALLAEKRQATISHAVTRGLNPNVPTRDSGVAWLGSVPAHWAITPLARLAVHRCDGPFGSGIKSEHYTDEGALVVRLQNIRAGAFNRGESVYLDEAYFLAQLQGHDVVEGDVLIAGLGDENNLLGRACVAPPDLGLALVKADCFRFRLDSARSVPYFVAWQLNSGAAYDAGMLSTGTTRSRIPLSTMASRKVALPPRAEQAELAKFIADENERLNSLTAEARRAIELLAERRTALITAAVTGQIDVRGTNARAAAKPAAVPCPA